MIPFPEVRSMKGPTRLHHVAFAARDVEATYDFYARRLGMRLVHAENHLTDKGWFRHFFFDMGGDESLGFFAFENVGEKPGWKTEISTGLGLPVWVNHVAFNVETLDDLAAMKKRVESNGVKLLMETDHGWCRLHLHGRPQRDHGRVHDDDEARGVRAERGRGVAHAAPAAIRVSRGRPQGHLDDGQGPLATELKPFG
jgi:catechol 2,3-dioxygenase-like lactoylglutathione lyase family enzyme